MFFIFYKMGAPGRRVASFTVAVVFFIVPAFSRHSDCGCHYQANKFIAYRYSAEGNPDSALFYFKKAFSGGHAALNDLLMAADRAIQIDSLEVARYFMLRAFGQGQTLKGYRQFVKWSGRGKINEDSWFSKDSIEQIVSRYQNLLNQKLMSELKRLEDNDQRFRNDEIASSDDQRHLQDSLNADDLKKIVTALGHLPGYNEVGPEGVGILELLFLHMDPENLGWFLPHVIQQIRNCEYFNVDGLAYQIDRIAVSSGLALYIDEKNALRWDTVMPEFLNRQYYSVTGYWYDISPADGTNYFWPVFDPILKNHLKSTRERLCLDSYEHYIRRKAWIKSVPANELRKLFGG